MRKNPQMTLYAVEMSGLINKLTVLTKKQLSSNCNITPYQIGCYCYHLR